MCRIEWQDGIRFYVSETSKVINFTSKDAYIMTINVSEIEVLKAALALAVRMGWNSSKEYGVHLKINGQNKEEYIVAGEYKKDEKGNIIYGREIETLHADWHQKPEKLVVNYRDIHIWEEVRRFASGELLDELS